MLATSHLLVKVKSRLTLSVMTLLKVVTMTRVNPKDAVDKINNEGEVTAVVSQDLPRKKQMVKTEEPKLKNRKLSNQPRKIMIIAHQSVIDVVDQEKVAKAVKIKIVLKPLNTKRVKINNKILTASQISRLFLVKIPSNSSSVSHKRLVKTSKSSSAGDLEHQKKARMMKNLANNSKERHVVMRIVAEIVTKTVTTKSLVHHVKTSNKDKMMLTAVILILVVMMNAHREVEIVAMVSVVAVVAEITKEELVMASLDLREMSSSKDNHATMAMVETKAVVVNLRVRAQNKANPFMVNSINDQPINHPSKLRNDFS